LSGCLRMWCEPVEWWIKNPARRRAR